MAEIWHELATKNLEKGDVVEYSWPGEYNNQHGYIVLSKEKLLFIEEHGFIHRSDTLRLNLPYDNIAKIGTTGAQTLDLTTLKGAKYAIQTTFLSNLKEHLESVMKQTKGEAVTAAQA